MELYNKGYVNGEPVYGEQYTTEEIVAQLYVSKEWADFREKFDINAEGNQTLLGWLIDKLDPHPELADLQRLLRTVLAAGGVVRVQGTQYEFELVPVVEPVIEPEVPRDRNGNPLNASQLAWKSYREFAESHSMQECRNRARTDAGFASFMRKNLEREASGGVGDAVENLNQRQQVSTPPAEELVAFAAEYYRTPTEKLRQLKRADSNPFGYQDWNNKFEACVAAGLI
jgi:hypothetical protein